MWNKERKEQFISESDIAIVKRRASLLVFSLFSEYEDMWCADLCEQPADKLQSVLDTISTSRKDGLHQKILILKYYFEWCQEKGYKTTDAIEHLFNNTAVALKKETVGSPEELKRVLDQTYGPSDTSCNIVFKGYAWLAFAGVPYSALCDITSDDIISNVTYVRYEGKCYPIYKEAVNDIRNLQTLTVLTYTHWNRTYDYARPRAEGNHLLRGRASSIPNIRTLQKGIHKVEECTEKSLKARTIFLSGVFYRFKVAFDELVHDDRRASQNKTEMYCVFVKTAYQECDNAPDYKVIYDNFENFYDDFMSWMEVHYPDEVYNFLIG